MQVTKLAAALQMDPVELRRRNIWQEGSVLPTRSVVPAGCTAAQVLEEAATRGAGIKPIWEVNKLQVWSREPRERLLRRSGLDITRGRLH